MKAAVWVWVATFLVRTSRHGRWYRGPNPDRKHASVRLVDAIAIVRCAEAIESKNVKATERANENLSGMLFCLEGMGSRAEGLKAVVWAA